MKTEDEIIILHYTSFGEKSVILHCLSRQWGRRSFLVRNAVRQKAFFQPLSILSCEITDNRLSQLWTASSFSASCPLSGIRNSYGKNAISMFLSEVLYRALHEGEADSGLFDWCKEEILSLNDAQGGWADFHLAFLLDMAAALGFAPDKLSLLPFMDGRAPLLDALLEKDFTRPELSSLSGDVRREICARLLQYLEFHLECRINVRSLDILGELF